MDLTDRQCHILLKIVHQLCGMRVERFLERLNNALRERLKATTVTSIDKYIDLLQNSPGEVANFVSILTINWTFFFRENQQIEFLLEHVDRSRHLKIWSAACSIGAEPYSIAVQFLEDGFTFDILATDISDIALEKTKRGIYKDEHVAEVPQYILYKYFQRGYGKQEGYMRVRREVRKYIKVMKHNILSNTQPIGRFDIVFCRNVLMYFDDDDREKVIHKLYRALNQGGYLITGMAESIFAYNHQFTSIKKRPSIYRKPK